MQFLSMPCSKLSLGSIGNQLPGFVTPQSHLEQVFLYDFEYSEIKGALPNNFSLHTAFKFAYYHLNVASQK